MSTDATLFDALITGNARKVMEELFPSGPQKPELGPCDTCGERPGDRIATEARISVCEECDEADYRQMRRLPRFRTDDDAAAYEAGVRSRGEI